MSDPQAIIDTAIAANATTLGCPQASDIFRTTYKNSLKCRVNLTKIQRTYLQSYCDFPIVFIGGRTVTNDHPVLVALRDFARDILEDSFHISQTAERTLIVQANAREIRQYMHNPHIHFHVMGASNKDHDRIIRPALREIATMLKKKASKKDKRVFLPPSQSVDATDMRPVVKRYYEVEEVLRDWVNLAKLPSTIHTGLIEANTLVFEDSIYHYSERDIVDLFLRTNASVAYGYAMMPWELIFPDIPSSKIYKYDRKGDDAYMTFPQGYSNGYWRKYSTWSTLMKKPVLHHNGISVMVEFTTRMGPMVVFKLIRCKVGERIVRTMQLPEKERYVKILDIYGSINKRTCRATNPLRYYTVKECEVYDTFNYLLALDPKSITFTNCVTYVRRRMGGVSLVTQELLAPWSLPASRVYTFCLAMTLQAKMMTEKSRDVVTNIRATDWKEKFVRYINSTSRFVFYPIYLLWDWILSEDLLDKIILTPEDSVFQVADVKIKKRNVTEVKCLNVDLACDNPNEDDIPACPICFALLGRLGDQKIKCEHVDPSEVEIHMTDDEVQKFRTTLIDNDLDPQGLKVLKERAVKNVPNAGFRLNVKVYYVHAGPGCGKSYMIRQLASEEDLVMAPFTKLKPDYERLKNEQGEDYNLVFKTNHRALETKGHRRIFLDEFTSMPFEYLAITAYNNNAEEIFLVGDTKQCKVLEPTEGIYIGSKINLDEVSKHTLLVNFRNPKDTVALLNRLYGYEMEAYSEIEKSIEVVEVTDVPTDIKAVPLCFTKSSSMTFTNEEGNTVRRNQGQTCKISTLYINSLDGTLLQTECLQIVGLSRHTEKCYIVTDKSPETVKFLESLKLDTDFYEHIQTFLKFPDMDTKGYEFVDKAVDLVLPKVKAVNDAYLLTESMLNPAVTLPGLSIHNQEASQVVQGHFASGKTSSDDLLAPINKRHHPVNLNDVYWCLGNGLGNRFSSKVPFQTLRVMEARYLCKVPTYRLGHSQDLLIGAILDLWFDECVTDRSLAEVFDEYVINDVYTEYFTHLQRKHYSESYKGSGGFDDPNARDIRFNLKSIFKPKHNSLDVFKAGQGISAWSKSTCAMFCGVFRLLTRGVANTEKGFVMTDCYVNTIEFVNTVKTQFDRLNEISQFAVTDGAEFDANQNEFTQRLEMEYWRRHGLSDTFIKLYYSFRKNYKVVSPFASGTAKYQKTSGEPGTLINNGVVSKLISNFVVRGEGDFSIVYKGDDFAKKQLNLVLQKERLDDINRACALKLKVNIGKGADFCGLIVYENVFTLSLPRKLNKIMGHAFRDYKHFCEYQSSLRDYVHDINNIGTLESIIGANAALYGCEYDEMEAVYMAIDSWSHIDREQFYNIATKQTYCPSVPQRGSSDDLYMLECCQLNGELNEHQYLSYLKDQIKLLKTKTTTKQTKKKAFQTIFDPQADLPPKILKEMDLPFIELGQLSNSEYIKNWYKTKERLYNPCPVKERDCKPEFYENYEFDLWFDCQTGDKTMLNL